MANTDNKVDYVRQADLKDLPGKLLGYLGQGGKYPGVAARFSDDKGEYRASVYGDVRDRLLTYNIGEDLDLKRDGKGNSVTAYLVAANDATHRAFRDMLEEKDGGGSKGGGRGGGRGGR